MERSYSHSINITPDNANNLPLEPFALYVGSGGDINCIMAKGTANTLFKAVANGALLSIRVSKVWANGTTANNILGLY